MPALEVEIKTYTLTSMGLSLLSLSLLLLILGFYICIYIPDCTGSVNWIMCMVHIYECTEKKAKSTHEKNPNKNIVKIKQNITK